MYIIGENIHIISEKVKEALKARDARFFQELAVKQVEAGAQALDLNLGPRKADGTEVFPWIVETVQAVVDVPLSFDTTNLAGIEAGLKKTDIAKKIARQSGVSEGQAADRLDAVVRQIPTNLRHGKESPLPGLGRVVHAPDGRDAFERDWGKGGG